ncbi:hypothetical protein [Microcoleus sp. B9-D4]
MQELKQGPLKKIDRQLLIKLIDRPIGQKINQYAWVKLDPPGA